jgi:sulfate transport system ATP-binding protein
MSIEVLGITKRFGSFTALENVNCRFPDGHLVALLGPSGSGKTSLLRIIAGLDTADSGSVLFDGTDATQLRARDRQVGFVFQHYALFRHMSVFENVAFGLRVKSRAVRPPEADIRSRVEQLLKLVQLDWMGDRLPSQLSRWRWSRACCCSTSLSGRWTRRCARSCGAGCGGCTTRST